VYGNVHFEARRVCVLLCLAAALLLVGRAAPSSMPATVRIAALAPLTVSGRGFEPHERVGVRVSIGRLSVRRAAVANALGRFWVRFPPLLVADACRAYVVVVASGSRGNHASTRRQCLTPDPQR